MRSLSLEATLQAIGIELVRHGLARDTYGARLTDVIRDHYGCTRVRFWRMRHGVGGMHLHAIACSESDDPDRTRSSATLMNCRVYICEAVFLKPLLSRRVFTCDDTSLPPWNATIRAREPFAARALMDALVCVNGKPFGVISCEQTDRSRRWSSAELTTLRRTANTVALLVLHAVGSRLRRDSSKT